jgi:hypothetical protein
MDNKKNDSLQWDVLTCLFLAPNMRLQWKELRDSLHKKYGQYDKESFETIFARALSRLIKAGDLKKDDKSHQEVFYYIPKRRQQKIIDGISKRFLYRGVDEFWERFSLDQKKRVAKDLALSNAMMAQNQKNIVKDMFNMFGGWADNWLVELNDPLNTKSSNFTLEDKNKLSDAIGKLKGHIAEIDSNIKAEDKFVLENYNSLIDLSFDFLNYVVDPLYGGNGIKAVHDLMKRAIDEQKMKSSGGQID